MFDVAGHGGSVDRSARRFPVRSILSRVAFGCVLLSGLSWSRPALAGALYHCTGASGEAVFSSSKAGYRDCRRIRTFAAPSPRHRAPPPRVSLTAVTGSVATTARRLPAAEATPTSLARVQGSVVATAQARSTAGVPRESLSAVQGASETHVDDGVPLTAVAGGRSGQWSYHESRMAAADVTAATATQGSRVLRGAVYRIVRGDGSVEYTNLRPAAGQKGHAVTMLFSYIATCVACDLHSTVRWGSVPLNLTAYADTIRSASVEYDVDEAFLRAIIHAESAFNPRAMSLQGAQGLMQLMPATASDMGVLDAFNTDQNIRGGARYLSLLLHDFKGNERLAAAAYNAGPGAVQRYSGVPPYAETTVYVERVETLRRRYESAIHPPLAAAAIGHG
ncbi:MAG: lytic transglycosylase domain-containing protein [Rhodanobacter sp.]|jgi:hypothetical protein|nr:lytic transglycosylase domain-containing protein [Rhodanobacter sp.]